MILTLLVGLVLSATAQVVVSPGTPTVAQGATQQFTASGGTGPYTYTLAAGSAGSITSGGLYTPPSTVTVKQVVGGCQMLPPDHIYNTRIDALPVHASNTALMALLTANLSFEVSFGTNVLTNATGTKNLITAYTTPNDGLYQIASWPFLKRESGVFTAPFGGLDRHVIGVNRETCAFNDVYNDYAVGDNGPAQNNCPTCTAQSAVKYNGNDHILPTTGATDAAGMEQQPVSLRLDDIRSGALQHALRFTLGNGIIEPAHIWPATANAVPYCVPGTCFKYGQYLRLKSSFSIAGYSATAQVILLGLQRYGMILTDGGSQLAIQTNTDLLLDPNVRAALNEIAVTSVVNANDFEVVDTSTMSISSASGAVSRTNGYVTPTQFVEVIATDSLGATGTTRIALQGITVGVPEPTMTIMGGHAVQLSSWVNGTATQTVTWSMSPTVGTLSGTGLYTAPTGVTTPTTTRITVTSTVESTAVAYIDVVVWPEGDSTVRIDVGASTDYTDAGGKKWFKDSYTQYEAGAVGNATDVSGWPGGTPDYHFSQSYHRADVLYKWYLPNGNYRVTLYTGISFGPTTIDPTYYRCHYETSGQLVYRNKSLQSIVGSARYVPGSITLPMKVTAGSGTLAIRHLDNLDSLSVCPVSAIKIEPDATPASIVIDDAGVTGDMTIGQTRQLYAVGWYIDNSATWSVVAGPGSVSAGGLYTAPLAAPSAPTTVTVRATSTVDGSKTADYSLTFVFGTIVVTPASSSVSRGQTKQFAATINGVSYSNVTWSRSGSQGAISSTGLYTAPSTITDGTITITATSTDDGSKTGTTSLALQQLISPVRIAAGRAVVDGPATDNSGNSWAVDVGYATVGTTFGVAGLAIANTLDDDVYRWHRYAYGSSSDVIAYEIPNLPAGIYSVTLRWAEIETTSQGNKMDVVIEGVTVLTDFDPVTAAGAVRTAYDQTFAVAVTDGTANVSFVVKPGAGYIGASINAIEFVDRGPLSVRTVGTTGVSGRVQWQ